MKLLLLGDCHLRVRTPRRRTEADFAMVCLGKLGQALGIAYKYDCNLILQPGDFFDCRSPSKALIADVINLLRAFGDKQIFAVHGQHDQSYHSQASKSNSALRILEAAGVVRLLDSSRWFKEGGGIPEIEFYGAAFGQDIPVPKDENDYNILVVHAAVGDKPLWPGHDLTSPGEFARQHPGYDLIVVGDYHYSFKSTPRIRLQEGNKPKLTTIINPGCLLRLTAGIRDRQHRPKVVLWETNTNEAEDIYLDVASADEAFDLTDLEASTDRAEFEQMVQALRDGGQIATSFRKNLLTYYEKNVISDEIQQKVAEVAGIIEGRRTVK